MSNELELVTENAAADSWVDATPGAITTGYQAQNTTISAAYIGMDNSSVSVSGSDVVVAVSGPIDDSGLLFSVGSAVTLTPPSSGTYYIRVIAGTAWNQRSLELTTDVPSWDAVKNGLYSSGKRVLNWVIVHDGTTITLARPLEPQGNNVTLSGDLACVNFSPSGTSMWEGESGSHVLSTGSWLIPGGAYMFITTGGSCYFEIYNGSTWNGGLVAPGAGFYVSDGTNYRFRFNGATTTIYYRKVW